MAALEELEETAQALVDESRAPRRRTGAARPTADRRIAPPVRRPLVKEKNHPQFAANLSMLYPELDFLQRFEAAARDGFRAVEFLFPYPLRTVAN